jgi:hypothetical protein
MSETAMLQWYSKEELRLGESRGTLKSRESRVPRLALTSCARQPHCPTVGSIGNPGRRCSRVTCCMWHGLCAKTHPLPPPGPVATIPGQVLGEGHREWLLVRDKGGHRVQASTLGPSCRGCQWVFTRFASCSHQVDSLLRSQEPCARGQVCDPSLDSSFCGMHERGICPQPRARKQSRRRRTQGTLTLDGCIGDAGVEIFTKQMEAVEARRPWGFVQMAQFAHRASLVACPLSCSILTWLAPRECRLGACRGGGRCLPERPPSPAQAAGAFNPGKKFLRIKGATKEQAALLADVASTLRRAGAVLKEWESNIETMGGPPQQPLAAKVGQESEGWGGALLNPFAGRTKTSNFLSLSLDSQRDLQAAGGVRTDEPASGPSLADTSRTQPILLRSPSSTAWFVPARCETGLGPRPPSLGHWH